MQTFIISTSLLTKGHSDLFQSSKDSISESTTGTFQQQGQTNELPGVKSSLVISM